MKIFIKKTNTTNGTIKEMLWVNFMVDGKRIRKSLKLENTRANMKKAEQEILPTLQYKLMNGEVRKTSKEVPTVDEYVKYSFELHKGHRISSTRYAQEKYYIKYIKGIFGHKKLDNIEGDEITLWQNSLQEKHRLAKSYIGKIRGILNTMFNDAVQNKIIKINPVQFVQSLNETVNQKVQRIGLKPFSHKEIEKILNATDGQDRNIIATLFFTGLRAGELIGLKWDCVDFENNMIYVRRQVVNGEFREHLKTTRSKRSIPIIEVLLPYLKNQYMLTGKNDDFVFLTEKTKKYYYSANKIREQIWNKAIKNANVPYRNLHQTRGTFISTLISAGEDINYVSRIAGHENVKVTLERYSEYIPAPKENFGNCFNKVQSQFGTKLTPNETLDEKETMNRELEALWRAQRDSNP